MCVVCVFSCYFVAVVAVFVFVFVVVAFSLDLLASHEGHIAAI